MATNVITGETGYIPVGFVKDVNEAASDVEVLAKYRKNLSRIEYVSSALDEFLSLKDSISEPTFNNQMALERKARSYFTEFSIFLDHWKNYAGHGEKKGEFKKLYEEKTHEAFDSSDYYALATMLRNYVTHDSDIVQGSFWGESIFDVGCSKTTLLNSKIFTKKRNKS